MAKKYYLKAPWQREYTEVTKEKWIQAERNAGFRPKGLVSTDPQYMKVCATGGFSASNGIRGKIEHNMKG